MTSRLKVACVSVFVAGMTWFAPAIKADEWNEETTFTFSGPVEVPGDVLQPGTYVFKLADSESNRDIVQIYNQDQTHLITTVMGIPDVRQEPAGKAILTFEERAAGVPEAVHSWFYPGDNYGVVFVYPKAEQQYAASPAPTAEPSAAAETPAPGNE